MSRLVKSRLAKLAAAFLLLAAAAPAVQAQDLPNKPIHVVIAFPPGGPTDFVGRLVADKVKDILGQTIIIENKPGANGAIGADYVAKSAPDGTTLFLTTMGAVAITPHMRNDVPYDVIRDFAPVTLVVRNTTMIVMKADSPANSMKDLAAMAKAKPGELTFASTGVGANTHLALELFQTAAGVKFIHVPYRGVGPAFTDMFAGNVQMLSASPVELMPHVDSKKVKPLGISSKDRSRHLPNVPTISETLPTPFVATYNGILAPKETPREIVAAISKAIVDAVKTPEFSDKLLKVGVEPSGTTPEEMAKTMVVDKESWLAVKDDVAAAMKQQ